MKRKTKSRTESLRLMLANKRDRLQNEITRDLDKGLTDDRLLRVDQMIESGDQAAIGVTKDIEIQVMEIKNRTLQAIDGALERIKRGRYGLCEECGDQIEPARLDVVPFALYCLNCQKQLEREEKGRKIVQREFWSGTESILERQNEE
jgi:DnaK suppressor protein